MNSRLPIESSPILDLYKELDADLRKDSLGPNIRDLLAKYVANHDDWKEYVNFNEHKYCRNLVWSNDLLELIVLCWLPHQQSPVHNHAGQHCWAACLQGTIQETHFLFQNTQSVFGEGPLVENGTQVFNAGEVSYISDDIALHVLQPINNQSGITLHLYSKPIPECNIYCRQYGTITKRKMGFYTINKKLQPQVPVPSCTETSTASTTSTSVTPSTSDDAPNKNDSSLEVGVKLRSTV